MLYFSRWQTLLILGLVLLGVVFTTPNFFPKATVEAWPGWLPARQLNLGLDLRGGSHLLLEVDVDFIVTERLENLQDEIRTRLREERIAYTGLRLDGDAVRLTVADADKRRAAEAAIRTLIAPVGAGLLGGQRAQFDLAVDGETLSVRFEEVARREAARTALGQSIEILRRRIDESGLAEPTIQPQGAARIIVQMPGLKDPQQLRALVGTTAKMTFHMVDVSTTAEDVQASGRVPPGSQLLPSSEDPALPYLVRRRVLVSGENLVDAQATIDPNTGEYVVSFRFDNEGARRFGEATRKNVGLPFAIVLDGKVITAPVINEAIRGGQGQITGGGRGFTAAGANELAVLLRAGALPAPLTIIEERTVGAELGADSVRAGTIAAIVAFAAVCLFMIVAYGLFGVFANAALIANVMLIFGILSVLGGTLTLPGIAGIVLTIGMAVDANVLIYERIKDEQRSGKTPVNAITAGFSRAFSAILDSNVTTLLSALILFQLGAGPVRGFAVTLAIGVLTSVFTAIVFTRLIIATWVAGVRPKSLSL